MYVETLFSALFYEGRCLVIVGFKGRYTLCTRKRPKAKERSNSVNVYDVNQGVRTVRSPLSVFDPFRWQSGKSMKLRAQIRNAESVYRSRSFTCVLLVQSFSFKFSLNLLTSTFYRGVIKRYCRNFNIKKYKENMFMGSDKFIL
jgi:hypothetical protein